MKTTIDKAELKKQIIYNVKTLYRKTIDEATPQQVFQAVSYALKDDIIDQWIATHKEIERTDAKTLYYLSMEFLMGRALGNNILNLCAQNEVKEVLEELGFDLNTIEDQEPDPALGNGGLGRLAACFLDSLATLGYPAYGCGIRYKYGMFAQKIEDGYQREVPDDWLRDGYPFEIRRAEYACEVKFGGYVTVTKDETGREHFGQAGYQSVRAVPYDLPVVGYGNNVVNTLRIWDAEPINTFNLDSFDKGDYQKAVEQENLAKNIVEVLYPNDNHYAGKELRLKQQYFFISASLQTAVNKYKKAHNGDVTKMYEKVAFQMNDTHPSMAVAELMRILMDEENLTWEAAWEITTKCCAYTNHTIMAEALEKWPIELFSRLLPRIYGIVEEINRRFVEEIEATYPGNHEKIAKMVKTRIEVFPDIEALVDFFQEVPEYDSEMYVHKKMKTTKESSLQLLNEVLPVLEAQEDFSNDALFASLSAFAKEKGYKTGFVMWPIRTAVSGKQSTPGGATELMEILGKEESIARIKAAIEKLSE